MLTGKVDDYGRALLPLVVAHPETGQEIAVEAWIDTAFTGWLSLLPEQVGRLGLRSGNRIPGVVADGSQVSFETVECRVAWFDRTEEGVAIISPGKFATIGIHLLTNCSLLVEYPKQRVTLTYHPDT